MTTNTIPLRKDIPKEHTWNAESVYSSPEVWQLDYNETMAQLSELDAYRGRLGEGAAVIADVLELADQWQRRVQKIMFYGLMSQSMDTADAHANAMAGQAQGLVGRFVSTVSFIPSEIITLGEEKTRAWFTEEPRLAVYAHWLDDLFRKQAHVRSAEVEQLLGMTLEPFSELENAAEMLTNADLQFAPAVTSTGESRPVTQGLHDANLKSEDRELRRTSHESYTKGYLSFKNTLASTLGGAIKRDVFFARARNYGSSLEAALGEHNIPVEVFHNLIDTFKANIPTWHKYWRVRRKALGVDTLHPYDIWAPLTQKPTFVPYEKSVEWIAEGMQVLGEDYSEAMYRGCMEERWVDIYPNQGKRQGAFSFGSPDTYPFIMTNYTNDLKSTSTLAHELGHSMHSYYTRKSQPTVYTDYSLFVAEVASNFNQAVVRDYLFKTQLDPQFQIEIIEEAMSNFHRYFFIMPTLARFELEMHERAERGEPITADAMIEFMADVFGEGYGNEMTYDRDQVGITWATFGHLYANFYVFQYATGISAAHELAKPILAGDADAVTNYRQFLSAGSSVYPLDALKIAGVDMTTPQAVETTFSVLSEYVDRLEHLIGEV